MSYSFFIGIRYGRNKRNDETMFEVISFDILLSKLHNQSKEQTSGLLYFYTSHKMISARESAVLGTPAFTKAFTRAPFEALFNLSVAYAILRAYLSTSLALEGESGLIAHLRVFPQLCKPIQMLLWLLEIHQ